MDEILVNVMMASRVLGICTDTLRASPERYGLTVLRTGGGHRRYRLSEVQAAAERMQEKKIDKKR